MFTIVGPLVPHFWTNAIYKTPLFDLRSPRSPRRGRSAFAKPAVDENWTKTKLPSGNKGKLEFKDALIKFWPIYDIYMIWWYMYISECIDINYAYVRIGVVSWIPLGPFWCGFIWMFLDSLPATILPRHGSQYSMMFQCSNFVLPADRLRRPIDHISLSIYQSIDPSTYVYIVCPIVYLGRKSYKPRLNPFGEYWGY